jgi:preprotein translocase subunit SecD
MKGSSAILIVLLAARCDGFVGEVRVDAPQGPSVAVVDPDYLVLRPVTSVAGPGSATASVYGQTVHYEPTARILDLRHFDPRTAKIEEALPGTYAVSIRTTHEGNRLLGEWTAANLERQLGVFVDGKLISAPHIKSKITDMIVIEDDFTRPQAEAVVGRLRRGGAAV